MNGKQERFGDVSKQIENVRIDNLDYRNIYYMI